jgi:TRAP-type C4-dicarboxylate transport system substrate-binding protein
MLLRVLLSAAALAVALAALVGLGAGPAGARTLKIATLAPEGSAWMREMRAAAEAVEEQTDGRVRLKFYPGGVMGNDKTVLRKMRAGQLHGGAFTSGSIASVYPNLELYGIPLLFRSREEVDYVRARMDETMVEGMEAVGLVALAINDQGFAYLMTQEPAREVADLEGAKVWIQEGDTMSQTAFEAAGVSPVQLSLADVYTALQTGLVDTVAAPPMGAIALQWHTRVNYVTDVPLSYLTGTLVIDSRAFEKLRPADQKVLRDVVAATAARMDRETREGEQDAREALRAQGIEFVSPATPEEVERWHEIAREAMADVRKQGIYDDAVIDAIERHLAEFRSASGAP